MEVVNIENEKVELTELESTVYTAIKECDGFDDCYCASLHEVSDNAELSIKVVRGVVSSLIKKELAYIDELISGCGGWVILFEDRI